MDNTLKYTGGDQTNKQVLFGLLNDMDDLTDDIKVALCIEFPIGTKVEVEYGSGKSHGVVQSYWVKGYEAALRVVLHTGKQHFIDVRYVLSKKGGN